MAQSEHFSLETIDQAIAEAFEFDELITDTERGAMRLHQVEGIDQQIGQIGGVMILGYGAQE